MTGRLYIDNTDIFSQFRIAIREEGYKGLISSANLKSIDYIDWPEEDGIEADLSNPTLDTKEFDISFGNIDNTSTENFLAFLSDVPYHVFDFRELGISRKLRLISQPSKETIQTAEAFSLRFADDFPLDGYSYLEPINPLNQKGYTLDDRLLSAYGVIVLSGSDDEIMKIPSVKKNLLQNYKHLNGSIYDNSYVKYQHKDVALKCVMVTPSMPEFWRNYNAFIFDLIRPNERLFGVEHLEDTFSCFYKSCQVSQFFTTENKVWCEFTLTLVFTDFRPKHSWYILGTEDYNILGTEDLKALMI